MYFSNQPASLHVAIVYSYVYNTYTYTHAFAHVWSVLSESCG